MTLCTLINTLQKKNKVAHNQSIKNIGFMFDM